MDECKCVLWSFTTLGKSDPRSALPTEAPFLSRMVKALVLSELWYPQGGGAELATHLAIGALQKDGLNVTVLTGSETHDRPSGVRYVSSPLLKARSKIHLWR